MTFRKAKLIYGTYVTPEVETALENLDDPDLEGCESLEVAESLGFHDEYTASGDDLVAWMGYLIQDVNTFNPSCLTHLLKASQEMEFKRVTETEEEVSALPESIKKLLPPTDVYIIWYDS